MTMDMKRKSTIRDIADRANVSISTVSRVLNDPDSVKVSKREAVLSAIHELNYQPNILAQRLAGGQSLTIGVLTQFINSPHFGTMTRGIFQGLSGSSYSVIFADGSFEPTIEHDMVQNLISRRIDGLIILEGRLPEEELRQLNEHIPLVVVGRCVSGIMDRCLWMDQFRASYEATRYLISLGHQNIAHIIGVREQQDAVDRLEGYMQALRDSGIEPDPDLLVQGDFQEQSGVVAVEMLLTRRRTFSAIFAANDQMAIGARLALYRRGIRVPDDVSLIGFDDQAQSAYITPPLTTVRQPAFQMGEVSAHAMLRMLAGEAPDLPEFSGELIVRESTGHRR
jgi:LacI family transcriptional regulator